MFNSTWNFIDIDGAYVQQHAWNPWAEQKHLNDLDPEPLHAGEIMLGELPAGVPPKNAGGGFGPGLSQIERRG